VPSAHAHPKPGAHADVRISVQPDGVHMDCLMNLLFVDQLVRSTRAARDRIEPAEADSLSGSMAEYFGGAREGAMTALFDRPNRLLIDRVEVAPRIESIRVIEPEPETRPGFVPNPALLIPQVHVRIHYPSKSRPGSISLQWGTFPRDFVRLEGDVAPFSDVEAILTAGPSFELIRLTRTEPEYTWHAPQAAPDRLAAVPPPPDPAGRGAAILPATVGLLAIAIGLGVRPARPVARLAGRFAVMTGAVAVAWAAWTATLRPAGDLSLDDAQALAIFRPLHENIYRAFDFTRDTEVFDALARSVDGPILSNLHEQIYRSLVMQEEGGAVSRVRSLDMIEARVLHDAPPDRVRIDATWTVDGVVYHWGHSHERRNEHRATFALAPRPQGWRIVEASMTAQRRIPTADQAAISPAAAAATPPDPAGSPPGPPARSTPWKPDK